jgi:hypothetical protein
MMLEALRNLTASKREEGREQWRKLHTGASRFMFTTKYYSNDKTWKDEMGWACGMYFAGDKYRQDIGSET